MFAVQSFAKNIQNKHILLQMDNKTAVAYINKMGVGGHSIKTVELFGESILGLVPSKTVDSNCRLYPREKQSDCGLGKQKFCGFQQLETESNNFQESDVAIRSMQCRPFRKQVECSAEPLLQLKTRPTYKRKR